MAVKQRGDHVQYNRITEEFQSVCRIDLSTEEALVTVTNDLLRADG